MTATPSAMDHTRDASLFPLRAYGPITVTCRGV
jgi:hypothetical protein